MLRVLLARWQQGHRTMKFPDGPPPALSERYRGRPIVDGSKCPAGCQACRSICPTGALALVRPDSSKVEVEIDTGKCLFCRACERACPRGAVKFTGEYRLAAGLRLEDRAAHQLAAAVGMHQVEQPRHQLSAQRLHRVHIAALLLGHRKQPSVHRGSV